MTINLLAVGTSPVPSDKPDGYPTWWFQRDVIPRLDSSNSAPLWNNHAYPAPDDYAVANLGQLKYIATQAAAELDADLPGGAGSDIHNLVAQWAAPAAAGIVRDDYAALNLGQLKTVAQPFYDRLIAVHYIAAYPWDSSGLPSDDYAVANLGQLKYLFSFDLTYSSLGDGVPDWWKLAAGLMANDPNAISSPTGNTTLIVNGQPITYAQAYQQGVDPITAATANPANNPPPGQGHPLQQLPTVTYAAIDVSSANTQEDVDLVALDDTGRVGFHYFGPSTDGSGSLDKGVSFFQGSYTVTDSLPDVFFLGPYSDYWTERYVQSVNASGQLAGEVIESWYTGFSAGSITWAMVDANEYSPDGNGISGDYFGGPVGVSIHLGNSGLAMGTGSSYNIEINPAGDQWIPSTNPSLTPSVFSPSGIAAGAYLTDSNGKPLNFALGVFGSVTLIDRLAPLALSDSGLVVGDDKTLHDDTDALSVWNGSSTQRLSSLLPSVYANKIRFPRQPNGTPAPEAWINNNGDIVVAAMVLDDSGSTATWVSQMLLWRNALNPDNTAPKSLSFVSFPANASRNEFNASADFVGLVYDPATDHMAAALLLPVELTSDLNNDGQIDGGDSALKTAAYKDGASNDDIENGTEYLFANNQMSNGLPDQDDPKAPKGTKDDDDVECFKVTCDATWGAVWFEHPAIDKLAFYPNKQCNASEKLTFPFVLSGSNKLPKKIYVRAEGKFDSEVDGDLVMKFGKADKSVVWGSDKEKFSVVKGLGDTKYFQAARNYIMENNTLFFHGSKELWLRDDEGSCNERRGNSHVSI